MKKGNKIPIIAGIAAVVLIAVVVVILVINHKAGYRLLKVFEVEGTATVTRADIGDMEPYANMVLESGDRIKLESGEMSLQADEDKYIYLEDGTELILNASGNAKNSKTSIELISGAITNDIQNKLSPDSTYEINTPNATMSVRGTVYRAEVYKENGVTFTRISVFAGEVVTKLRGVRTNEKATSVLGGKEVLIYDDGKVRDYVSSPSDINYNSLPPSVLKILLGINQSGRKISISAEDAEEVMKGPFTVTFKYKGQEFGTQEVAVGDKVDIPKLQPSETGAWDYDFKKPIDHDVVIEWK